MNLIPWKTKWKENQGVSCSAQNVNCLSNFMTFLEASRMLCNTYPNSFSNHRIQIFVRLVIWITAWTIFTNCDIFYETWVTLHACEILKCEVTVRFNVSYLWVIHNFIVRTYLDVFGIWTRSSTTFVTIKHSRQWVRALWSRFLVVSWSHVVFCGDKNWLPMKALWMFGK